MNGRGASRWVLIVLGLFALASIGGLITTAMIGSSAEKYGSYGEVPIPGTGVIRLPRGEAIVSFHVGDHGGRGLRVPRLNFDITPPPGAPDPSVTEDLGSTVVVNDDVHRRVWFMKVDTEGDYRIITKGEVNGFVAPRLALGRTVSVEAPLWVFTALSIVTVDLAIAVWWFTRRRGKTAAPSEPVTDPYLPTDDGIRRF